MRQSEPTTAASSNTMEGSGSWLPFRNARKMRYISRQLAWMLCVSFLVGCHRNTETNSTTERVTASPNLPPEQPVQLGEPRGLGEYLREMSGKLGCYYALEDVPTPGFTHPPRIWDAEVIPSKGIDGIDALVKHLDAALHDYHVVRSTARPRVVHFIARELLVPGYPLDQQIDVDYAGKIRALPDAVTPLVNGKVRARQSFPVGGGYPFGDWVTEVDVHFRNTTVRDVLTLAVPLEVYGKLPLEQYGPWIWESVYRPLKDGPDFDVMFFDPPYAEPVLLSAYMQEMSEKLGCHFTLEDRLKSSPQQAWPRAYDLSIEPNVAPAPEIKTIDALVQKLQIDLSASAANPVGAYKVVRSVDCPSVIHIIAEDLIEEGYVLELPVNADFSGANHRFADYLGTLVDGKIGAADAGQLYVEGNYTTDVDVHVRGKTVREALTAAMPAVPVEGYSPVLWQAVRTEKSGQPIFRVAFRTNWW